MSDKKRVLSGNRPTGQLHWGNCFGALQKWHDIQSEYDCYFFIADWHALTTGYNQADQIETSVTEVLKEWLIMGLDPEKSTIFIQSLVPEHAEFHLLLSMITPLGWLERVPSFKDMQQQLKNKDINTYGFLGYPLLQTADILLYQADFVPVGEDQLAHLEFAREIVRRYQHLLTSSFLKEPLPLLSKATRVPGVDGRKMSKSFDNAIYMSDDADTIRNKLMQTITDPDRKRRNDPGNPSICNIFAYHQLYMDADSIADIESACKKGDIGCVDCKKRCIEKAISYWAPYEQKRNEYHGKENELMDIARAGSKKARMVAAQTIAQIRSDFGFGFSNAKK